MARHVHVYLPTRDSWEEGKHPRDGGKFASKPGAGAAPEKDGGGDKAARIKLLETRLNHLSDGAPLREKVKIAAELKTLRGEKPASTERPAPASGPAPADSGGMSKVLKEGLPENNSITDEELSKAAAYMAGKKGVDLLRMSDELGISVGKAKMLNDIRKKHFASQGPTKALTQADRAKRSLSERPAPRR